MKIQIRETPEVVTGARGPRSARSEIKGTKRNPVAQSEGEIVFQSRYANHRIQVTAPPDVKDPFTGRISQGRPKVAQFRDHILRVPKKDQDTIEWLSNHPKFRSEFWLFSEVQEAARAAERENAKRVLADPEQRAALLAELRESGELDFALPTPDVKPSEEESET